MWLKHCKMCVGAVGFVFTSVGVLLIWTTNTEMMTITEVVGALGQTWGEIKVNVYGGN